MINRIIQAKESKVFVVLILISLLFEIFGWITVGQSFLWSSERIFLIILQMAIIGIVAVGVSQVLIMGGLDLSGGSILAFTGLIAATLAQTSEGSRVVYPALVDMPVIVPVVAAISVGALLGLVNGGLIAKTSVPPFIVTLGMLVTARGLTRWYTNGNPVSFFVDSFNFIGKGSMPVLILLSLAALFHIIMRYTKYGRYTYAIGSNEQAARVTGINVARHKMLVYSMAGGLYAIAGIVLTARAQSGQSGAGMMFELDAISAVVIGGTSLFGGKGSIIGSMIGLIILGVLTSGFTFIGVNIFYVNIFRGIIIVLAVVIDRRINRSDNTA